MAVDAAQILINRESGNFVEGNVNIYNNPLGYGMMQAPVSGTTTVTDGLIPMYGSAMADSVLVKAPVKSESGVSYPIPVSRKRPRDGAFTNNHPLMYFAPNLQNQQNNTYRSSFTFVGEDFSSHLHQQQSEIDRFVAQQTHKMRIEMDEKRKSYSRRILAAVEDVIVKKLRAKEEEIEKMGKVNWALEERVKSLCVENQIWRELAQTNEATATALRTNLEQILAQVHQQEDQRRHQQNAAAAAELEDDAESCCGSNCGDSVSDHNKNSSEGGKGKLGNSDRMCRNCGKEEATVLILPCRHLCLCFGCGPLLHNCPICNCAKNVMVRVNLVPFPC